MSTLAINGGTPVFGDKKMMDLIPQWPPRYPETEEKLLEVYRSGAWGGCKNYEQKLMSEFAAFQEVYYLNVLLELLTALVTTPRLCLMPVLPTLPSRLLTFLPTELKQYTYTQ